MKVKKIEKLMLSGLSTTTNNKFEKESENGKIPKLWEDYFEKNIYGSTFNRANKKYMYGIYSDYTSDVNGDYKVTVGIEVTKPKNAIIIEDDRYLVFPKKGELPDVVIQTWEEIWDYFENNNLYERKYAIDFEKYINEDEIEIYISIK
jgi:predicted transcriptional regulator YdeE